MARTYAIQPIDNRNIAVAHDALAITIGNTSTSYTIDIPLIGHDAQVGMELLDGSGNDTSGIVLSNMVIMPLGIRVDVDITSAIVGTYNVSIVSGGRTDAELPYTPATLEITGAPGGVSYSYDGDIEVFGALSIAHTPGSETMGGDVTGTVGANTVTKIQGVNVSAAAPTNGQYLVYNLANTRWEATTISITLAGDVSGNSGTNTVDKIKGNPVTAGIPSLGDVLTWNGSSWTPSHRSFKHVTHADFSIIVAAGPGGQYHLDWSDPLYSDFDLLVNVSGSADATGTYRIILPDTDTLADGTVSRRVVTTASAGGKLSGQQLLVRCADAQDDARVLGNNLLGGSRPTMHILSPQDSITAVIYRQTTLLRAISFEHHAGVRCLARRVASLSAAAYTNPAGLAMQWDTALATSGENTYTQPSSPTYLSINLAGMNKRVRIEFEVVFTATTNSAWTLDAWIQFSTTGEVIGSRVLDGGENDNNDQHHLAGSVDYDWTAADGNVSLQLYRTGSAGNFTRAYLKIKEII